MLKLFSTPSIFFPKNIKKTGGGSFTPTITESEYQILSVLDNQIHPDVNPYDEAAEYFGRPRS